jgi:light-regulated signal transduction histidine kinase (bacteriophytochrome)
LPPDAQASRLELHSVEAVEQELQAFSYIVSHDLLTSFRHVAEFSRLLMKEFDGVLSDRQKLYAGQVHVATDKCQLMMEQLLAFSRLQQNPLERVRQDATPVLKLALFQLGAIDSGIAEVSVQPLGEVYADPALLALAFHHLLDNALKFRRPNARPHISVQPAHDEAFWRVRITDDGPGIEAAYREVAFRMFHRLNGENAYPGVGAGLAICRRIARRHGGEVSFLDCAEGACVELALPHGPVLH